LILARIFDKYVLTNIVQGTYFLRKDPLSCINFGEQQLENRSFPRDSPYSDVEEIRGPVQIAALAQNFADILFAALSGASALYLD
jgi:hypothetical protein